MNLLQVVLLSGLCTFVLNLIITPVLLYVADRFSWYDRIDHRKIHNGKIPRIGGVGIYLSFIVGLVIIYYARRPLTSEETGFVSLKLFLSFFIGLSVVQFLGLVDDFANLKARYKFVVQLLVAGAIAFTGHTFRYIYIPIARVVVDTGAFSYVLTVLWIAGVCNAVNFIDGVDGLAGGISSIIFLTMGIASILVKNISIAAMSFVLVFNKPKAKIFMGDSGSLFLGYALASMPLYDLSNSYAPMKLVLSISFLIIPLFDAIAAILRRLRKGMHVFDPDREHVHHKLMAFGFTNWQILFTLYGLTFLVCVSALLWIVKLSLLTEYILLGSWLVCLGFFIVLDRKNRKLQAKKDAESNIPASR
jgi:UDP-GlcNAc:undecaprenyl-phosphate GlcNAc-1-phosphate transferase